MEDQKAYIELREKYQKMAAELDEELIAEIEQEDGLLKEMLSQVEGIVL